MTLALMRFVRMATCAAAALAASVGTAIDLQGHRGARALAPENTLAGFRRALAEGVTTLELDVGVTRDGVVVIHHDLGLNPAIARRAGAWIDTPIDLVSLTRAELRAFDVGRLKPGTEYAARYPDQVPRDHELIPTLDQLFAMLRSLGERRVRFNIETKISPAAPGRTVAPEAMVEAILRVVARHGVAGRVSLQSFDWRTLAHARRLAPDIPIVHLTARQIWLDNIDPRWNAGLALADHGSLPRLVKAAGGDAWSPYHQELTEAGVREAKSQGLKVIPWTVNAREDIERMLDLGVDGIITDRPDLARAIILARDLPIQPIDWTPRRLGR